MTSQFFFLHCSLKILPVLEEKNFTMIGDAQIQFYSKVPTKHIRLHARKLIIQDISVKEYRSPNAAKLTSTYAVMNEEDFIDVFLLHVLIAKEIYILHIKYMIPLHQNPIGFFRSAYIDQDTNETRYYDLVQKCDVQYMWRLICYYQYNLLASTINLIFICLMLYLTQRCILRTFLSRWIAVSNFSPDYARTAYPCFDEPWIKTPFRISIGRKSNMRSHSNSMRKFTEKM